MNKIMCLWICLILALMPITTQAGEPIDNQINTVTMSGITLNPQLNISYYGDYEISVNVSTDSGNIDTVISNLTCISGDDGYCNQYVNGTPCMNKTLSYEMALKSGSIYNLTIIPDYFYPTIFYAPMNTTLYNEPYDIPIWRDNYHLMHFENLFTMTGNTTIFFEVNIDPNSITPPSSKDLLVYLVERNQDTTYFEENWIDKDGVELITSINYNDSPGDYHTTNSSHHIIKMSTNSDGTIGNKHLNVTDDFWIVVYCNTNSISRGWSLRGHDETVANNTEHWYIGSKSGWTVTHQSGIPDAHIHIVRRDGVIDGLNVTVWANDTTGGNQTIWDEFYFSDICACPPNPSLFITPISATYSGELNITWYPSLDPNLDDVFYTLVLLNSDGSYNRVLATNITDTYFIFDTTTTSNGWYDLKVISSDGELASDFVLSDQNGLFQIENIEPMLLILISVFPLIIMLSILIMISRNMEEIYEEG